MLSEARQHEREAAEMNEPLSAALEQTFMDHGFPGGVIRAFGAEGSLILAAGEDKDGTRITSPALREALERTAGTRLSTPEYFRKEDMVLMQCRPDRRFEVESYLASVCCEGGDVSGDVAKCFAAGHRFIAALSNGMGTGRIAHKTAAFAVDFLE
jgi:hypothetical protein